MYRFLFIFIALFLSLDMQAQQDFAYKDKFKLKNGNQFVGQLIRIGADTTEIELASGSRVLLLSDQIKSIYQSPTVSSKSSGNAIPLIERPYLYEGDRKDFLDFSFGLNFVGSSESVSYGLGMYFQYKRRLARQHFLQLGYGFEALSTFTSAYSHPITVGYEFVLFEDRVSPYINAKAGYAFLHSTDLDQDDFNQQWEVKGGYRYALGTGIIMKSKGTSLINLGLEYMVQDSEFNISNNWWGETRRDVLFRRIFLKLGFVF